jgi:fermentation-respiration switch protein FrsA (DUF1100 family)
MKRGNDMVENAKAENKKKPKTKKVILIISVSLIVLFLATLVLIPFAIMPMFLGQRYEQKQHNASDYGTEAERISLETDDALSLAAWRTRADNPKGTVIILSGIQNPSVTAFFGYAKMLADNGWDSMLIEMRARSQSEGKEIGFGMTEWRDVKAGVDFLSADAKMKDLPIVTMGTSMGGGTVIIAAGELPQVDGVISISAFSSWSDLFVDNMKMTGIPKFVGILDIPFINMYLGFHFGFDALAYSPLKGIAKLGDRPILMMHSTGDTQVPYTEFEKLLQAAKKNDAHVTTFIREGDEHFICYERFFDHPSEDQEFSSAILSFLSTSFQ